MSLSILSFAWDTCVYLGACLKILQIKVGTDAVEETVHQLTLAYSQDYVIATVQLAHEYLHLGKTSRAASVLEQAKDRLECEDVSVQTKIHFRLGQAKVQSQRGQREAR